MSQPQPNISIPNRLAAESTPNQSSVGAIGFVNQGVKTSTDPPDELLALDVVDELDNYDAVSSSITDLDDSLADPDYLEQPDDNNSSNDEIPTGNDSLEPNVVNSDFLSINPATGILEEISTSRETTRNDSLVQNVDDSNILLVNPEIGNIEEITRSRKRKRPDKISRKRTRNEGSWERNVRSNNRQCGLEYTTRKGKRKPMKQPIAVDGHKCRYRCNDKFSEQSRVDLCQTYYRLDDARKKDFLCRCIQTLPVERTRRSQGIRPKLKSCTYTLPVSDHKYERVCQNYFCKTFAISKNAVLYAVGNKDQRGHYVEQKRKCGKVPPNKTPEEQANFVRDHINSFPRMQSHYCRASTTAMYLSPDLTISQMYRLYVNDFCAIRGISNPITEPVYRRIFTQEFNLKFFVPKKDQCTTCNSFSEAVGEDKEALKPNWESHKLRERESLDMKAADKMSSAGDPTLRAITFDLQAVLPLPYAGDAQIFYMRKLAVYNFTIHESATKNGICYLWDETEGKRGANEIGSALLDYIKSLPNSVTKLTSFSDTCAGQNRNQFIAATMLYAVQNTQLQCIDLKYMESGHSYLEADSMHSTIEKAKRHSKVYNTREWELIIAGARKTPRPYTVKRLFHTDFLDLKEMSSTIIKNRTKNIKGEAVNWLLIKWLRFEKDQPFIIQYKTSLSATDFDAVVVQVNRGRRRSLAEIIPKQLYVARLPISCLKKNDLSKLVKSRVIPPDYASWYSDLPSSKAVPDNLSEPNGTESDAETD